MRGLWLPNAGIIAAGSVAIVLMAGQCATAAESLQVGTVSMDCEIRSSPGMSMPMTARLPRGMTVRIHHTEGEFYAILPPEGSESWINHRFLDRLDAKAERQNVALTKDSKIYIGNPAGPTDVSQVMLPKGQIVEIIGPKKSYDGTTWYPILPPRGEYRYILKSNVTIDNRSDIPAERGGWSSNLGSGSRGRDGVPGTLTSRSNESRVTVNHRLWESAEQAYQVGDYSKADQLFTQIYQDMKRNSSGTYDEQLLCFNRIAKCQEMLRQSAPRGDMGRIDGQGRPINGNSGGTAGTLASRSRDTGENTGRSQDGKTVNTGVVYIRRAAFEIDNRPAYAIENDRRDILYYAVAQNGVSVDTYTGRLVEISGTTQIRGDVRGVPFLQISRISPAR